MTYSYGTPFDSRPFPEELMTQRRLAALVAIGIATLLFLAAPAGPLFAATTRAADAPASVVIRDAPPLQFRGANSASPDKPGDTDCNSPAHWDGDTLYVFNSAGHPWRSAGPDVAHLNASYIRTEYDNQVNGGRWIECTWKADDGRLYGWYHNEPGGLVPGKGLTAPRIGAVRSDDNGATWHDLGLILEARPGTLFPETKNKYFAGGNGDFCCMLDRAGEFMYFYISTYGREPHEPAGPGVAQVGNLSRPGGVSEQGVSVARMRWADRDAPVGKVLKWHDHEWKEPGVGGRVTPFLPVAIDWHQENADAFWGPSIHWNTHLNQYVMLLNRAKDKDWTQEGVYVSFNRDVGDPTGWTKPVKIMEPVGPDRWYPQILGLDPQRPDREGGTDKLAGRRARLFVRGMSRWEIEFLRPGEK
jgi:hypothetical protein